MSENTTVEKAPEITEEECLALRRAAAARAAKNGGPKIKPMGIVRKIDPNDLSKEDEKILTGEAKFEDLLVKNIKDLKANPEKFEKLRAEMDAAAKARGTSVISFEPKSPAQAAPTGTVSGVPSEIVKPQSQPTAALTSQKPVKKSKKKKKKGK